MCALFLATVAPLILLCIWVHSCIDAPHWNFVPFFQQFILQYMRTAKVKRDSSAKIPVFTASSEIVWGHVQSTMSHDGLTCLSQRRADLRTACPNTSLAQWISYSSEVDGVIMSANGSKGSFSHSKVTIAQVSDTNIPVLTSQRYITTTVGRQHVKPPLNVWVAPFTPEWFATCCFLSPYSTKLYPLFLFHFRM